MKIIQLIYNLSSGGAERFVVDLCNRLARNPEDEVVLVMTDAIDNPKRRHYLGDLSPNVRWICLGCKSGLSVNSFRKVYLTIKREKPDIVHSHCQVLLLLFPALLIKKPKYFHTLHTLAQKCLIINWLKSVYGFLYKRKVFPITISETCKQSFVSLYGNNNVINIVNGREPVGHSELKDSVKQEIELLKANKTTPVFIHVARYGSPKNQPRLFRVFERLYREGIDFLLLCIGNGYKQEIVSHFSDGNKVILLGEKKNVGDYLLASDFFILSSDYEGLPLSLLEAMSVGVVPISTPAGGVIDVIRNGINGYMSERIDDDSLYQTVKVALSHRGEIGKEKIIHEYNDNYSMEKCAKEYYKIYLEK